MNTFDKILLVIRTFVNFPTAFADKLGFVKNIVLYKTRSGLYFFARGGSEDMAEIAVVASGQEYDLSAVSLPKGAIVFDLGAHIGTFSVYIAKKFVGSKIYAYEPENDNFSLLNRNLKKNKVKNVRSINKAISNYKGKGYLRTEAMNTDAYYLDKSITRKSNCVVTTLYDEAKSLKLDKIDALKIDIEGGEYDLLNDPKTIAFIRKNVRYIFMECHTLDKVRSPKKVKRIIRGSFEIKKHSRSVYVLKNTTLE